MKIGWYKSIQESLIDYQLPTDFATIKQISHNEWRSKVQSSIEKRHKERLHTECLETTDGVTKEKTKTASILTHITNANYKRQPQQEILKTTKHEAKTIIIARYGMLQCGKNFGGTMNRICNECETIDDENHRLNHCIKWKNSNFYDKSEKIDYDLIFSDKIEDLRRVIQSIEKVWNTRNAHGTMIV